MSQFTAATSLRVRIPGASLNCNGAGEVVVVEIPVTEEVAAETPPLTAAADQLRLRYPSFRDSRQALRPPVRFKPR